MTDTCHIGSLDADSLAMAVDELLPGLASRLRPDVLDALEQASGRESDARPKQALAMLLGNAYIASTDLVPLCQDTGSVWLLLEVGLDSHGRPIDVPSDIFSEIDDAVAAAWQAYALRASMVADALLDRSNSTDNTPSFCEVRFDSEVKGVKLSLMLKGGGSDNASLVSMLAPGDGWPAIKELVLEHVRAKGANACPPLVIGIGIGSTFDKVAGLAKRALLQPIGEPAGDPRLAKHQAELLEAVNDLGIGPGGLGGRTTALQVSIITAPCHIAALPVAVNLGCSAMRSGSWQLTGDWSA